MKRIMVVDDSQILEMEVRRLLEGTEYEIVFYCQNGETAIAMYGEVMPDLVTMDIIMPGIDGLEAAKTIMSQHPDAKIIMMSSMAYSDTIEEARSIGARDFIYKPFDREGLLSALDRVLLDA